jgi:hypothetical protein
MSASIGIREDKSRIGKTCFWDASRAVKHDRSSCCHDLQQTNPLKNPAEETIALFANRSDRTVTRLTMAFALGGAIMDIIAHTISALLANGSSISMLWGMWIPLCFITIPPIHYLCRRVQDLQTRLTLLESQLADRQTT